MAHWAVVAAPKLACPRAQLRGQLCYRSWISVVGSTAAEVKNGIQQGNEGVVTNFVPAWPRFGILVEQMVHSANDLRTDCKILLSLLLVLPVRTYQRAHKNFQEKGRKRQVETCLPARG